jgi:hypothetical protein
LIPAFSAGISWCGMASLSKCGYDGQPSSANTVVYPITVIMLISLLSGIVEGNSSNSNKCQNYTNPQGRRSAMVGAAGAHLFRLWDRLAAELTGTYGFLDVAVIDKGTAQSKVLF